MSTLEYLAAGNWTTRFRSTSTPSASSIGTAIHACRVVGPEPRSTGLKTGPGANGWGSTATCPPSTGARSSVAAKPHHNAVDFIVRASAGHPTCS